VTLAPLLAASPAVKLHAFAAMAAFALGVVQLSAPKGTLPHRAIGWFWVVLMLVISISAFWIHELRLLGALEPDSPFGDIYVGYIAGRSAARAAASRRAAPLRHDFDLLRRAGDRRIIHVRTGPHHAGRHRWPLKWRDRESLTE
jgi:uncharacterized membrane protein